MQQTARLDVACSRGFRLAVADPDVIFPSFRAGVFTLADARTRIPRTRTFRFFPPGIHGGASLFRRASFRRASASLSAFAAHLLVSHIIAACNVRRAESIGIRPRDPMSILCRASALRRNSRTRAKCAAFSRAPSEDSRRCPDLRFPICVSSEIEIVFRAAAEDFRVAILDDTRHVRPLHCPALAASF